MHSSRSLNRVLYYYFKFENNKKLLHSKNVSDQNSIFFCIYVKI